MADLEINKTSFANNHGRWNKDCLSSLFPASPSMQRDLPCLMNWPQAGTVHCNKKIHLRSCQWNARRHLSPSTSLGKVLEVTSNPVQFPTEMQWEEEEGQWEAVSNCRSGTSLPYAARATDRRDTLPPMVWKLLIAKKRKKTFWKTILSWTMDFQMIWQ